MTFLYDFLTIIKFSFGKILPSLCGSVNHFSMNYVIYSVKLYGNKSISLKGQSTHMGKTHLYKL